ncbi:MoaD/ThiS family protein [Salinispora arenicola]|uniref:ThiS family protein n=1 Tax=Salinispora arenicola TaxID=168697 RepID=A0A542XTF7_SALAC|nr:MoaD/ThiS family protein [Salinispora arenicola]MCN0152037.1 MoaD/ThiS family protein [Salinispora arenicola]TQL39128.1 hypothetical protein FB564_4357 [Salinispora arenicola]GIM88027.1 hypothetical protein Sar04_47630 [Salinispora arenicola]
MVTVLPSAGWAHREQMTFACHEDTVRDVIREFVESYPHYRRRLLDDDGEPLTYDSVTSTATSSRPPTVPGWTPADSTVAIVAPLAGG